MVSKEKCDLAVTFDIDLFTPCTKYEANLDGDYVREVIRQLMCYAINLHTFDGVEVMGEPEFEITIVNK